MGGISYGILNILCEPRRVTSSRDGGCSALCAWRSWCTALGWLPCTPRPRSPQGKFAPQDLWRSKGGLKALFYVIMIVPKVSLAAPTLGASTHMRMSGDLGNTIITRRSNPRLFKVSPRVLRKARPHTTCAMGNPRQYNNNMYYMLQAESLRFKLDTPRFW